MQCDGFAAETYSHYVLGTLDNLEREQLDSHLEFDCTRCRSEVQLSRRVWYGVALATARVEPRKALRNRVIATVQDPEKSGFRLLWWQPVVGLATIALAVLGGWEINSLRRTPIAVVHPLPSPVSLPQTPAVPVSPTETKKSVPAPRVTQQSVSREINELTNRLAEQQSRLASAEQEVARQTALLASAERAKVAAEKAQEAADQKYRAALAEPRPDAEEAQRLLASARARTQQLEKDIVEYRSLLATARQQRITPLQSTAFLADPNLRLVRLRGTQKNSNIEGHVFVSGDSQIIFYGSELPALPAGRAYQLWLIRGSAPAIVSAGVFQPDAQKRAVVQFGNRGLTSGITAVAVTDEPEGGSASPTGHKLLVGS